MRADWKQQIIETFGADSLAQLHQRISPTPTGNRLALTDDQVEYLARQVIRSVAEQQSTWTMWNVHAEAERALRSWISKHSAFDSVEVQRQAVERVVGRAISAEHSIVVTAPAMLSEPSTLRRSDGSSVFAQHGATRYTSSLILDAEQRLLHAARTPIPGGLEPLAVAGALDGFEATHGRQLDVGQRALVTAFATGDHQLAVGVGAAGTGKTTAMQALRYVTEQHGRRLIPLATSAASAAVLAADIGIAAENVHKFCWEYTPGKGRYADRLASGETVPASHQFFAINPGDVIVVDEAGMAGTLLLDQLTTIAAQRGATVRLLGDWRQLGAVESGGALRLITTDIGAVELNTLHRFSDPHEAEATRRLRAGDTAALDFYLANGRVIGGSRQAMTEAAYEAWKTDMLAGRTTLMVAATNRDTTILSARARADRVIAGHVEADGVQLRDGNFAGRGDWIITRCNDRINTCHRGRDFVKNGDTWTVIRRHRDGSLRVKHQEHGGRLTLPADYVVEHVELHYATTIYRAQGSTVDAVHVLADEQLARENLYVALTRGRHANHVYVATHELLPLDEDERVDRPRHDPDARAAREVLETVLSHEGVELSATETIRENQRMAASLATLVPQYLHAAEKAATVRYQDIVHGIFDPTTATRLTNDPAFSALVRALSSGESTGWQPEKLLSTASLRGPFTHTDTPAQLLAWRCASITAEQATPTPPAVTTYTGQEKLLPWLSGTDTSTHPEYGVYLAQAREQIRSRITSLALDATAHRPAWTTVFGPAPADPDTHQTWLRHLGIAAAYRDQYQVTDNTTGQPLGAYVPAGRAGASAYWKAAEAVIAAHRIAHPSDAYKDYDPALVSLAVDTFTNLTDQEKVAITATLAGQLGPLWFGTFEEAKAVPIPSLYANELIPVLQKRGHLTVIEPTENRPKQRPEMQPPHVDEHRIQAAREAERLAAIAARLHRPAAPKPSLESGNRPELLHPTPAQQPSPRPTW
jgi:hypothetical protein